MYRIPAIVPFASLIPQLRWRPWRLGRSSEFDATSKRLLSNTETREDASRQSEAKYRAIFENAAVGIALLKPDGSWLQVNDRLRQLLGYSSDELERLTFQDLTYPQDLAADLAQVQRVLDGEIDTYDLEKRYVRKDGNLVWAHLTVGCIRAPDRTVELFVSVLEDIGARKAAELELQAVSERDRIEAQAQIAYLAHHDALTQLPNRRTFELYLEAALERARSLGEQLAVVYIGLDHFKQVNDLFGTEVGDSVLYAVAQRLTDAVQDAFTARMGGDEFAIVCKAPQPMGAEYLARLTLEGLGEGLDVAGNRLQLEASMGVAVFPGDADNVADLIANADSAMERAKADGRHAICFFDRRTDSELRERRALHHDLRFAVERNELHLAYQPLVNTDRSAVGFEVLARWRHPLYGEIPPSKFIPLAEDGGLIFSIGRWILREACREAAAWTNPLPVSINLSPIQFRQGPELVDLVRLSCETSSRSGYVSRWMISAPAIPHCRGSRTSHSTRLKSINRLSRKLPSTRIPARLLGRSLHSVTDWVWSSSPKGWRLSNSWLSSSVTPAISCKAICSGARCPFGTMLVSCSPPEFACWSHGAISCWSQRSESSDRAGNHIWRRADNRKRSFRLGSARAKRASPSVLPLATRDENR